MLLVQIEVEAASSIVLPPEGFRSPIGPSTVLVFVLGRELLCGDCVSSVSRGGVGTTEVST